MNARSSHPAALSEDIARHPRSLTLFRRLRLLVACYVGISVLTLVAAYLLRDDPGLVNDTVWVRSGIVVATSLLMLTFVAGAARGRRAAYLRLRIASAVMVLAVAVLLSLPGLLPMWMRIEQGVCGLLLVSVVAVANSSHLRSQFSMDRGAA